MNDEACEEIRLAIVDGGNMTIAGFDRRHPVRLSICLGSALGASLFFMLTGPIAAFALDGAETFRDDFDGSRVDTANWTSVGTLFGKHFHKPEYKNYYTPDNVAVRDGSLRLATRQDGAKHRKQDASGRWYWEAPYGDLPDGIHVDGKDNDRYVYPASDPIPYTGGVVTGQLKRNGSKVAGFAQRYGTFSVRAKFPAGKGLWPAFWILPTSGDWPPEFDGAEFYGGYKGRGAMQIGHPYDLGDAWGWMTNFVWDNGSYGSFTNDYHTFSVTLGLEDDGTPYTSYAIDGRIVHMDQASGEQFGTANKVSDLVYRGELASQSGHFNGGSDKEWQGYYIVLNSGVGGINWQETPDYQQGIAQTFDDYAIDWVRVQAPNANLAGQQRQVNDLRATVGSNPSLFTSSSLSVFVRALDAADIALAKPSTSVEEADAAVEQLRIATRALSFNKRVSMVSYEEPSLRVLEGSSFKLPDDLDITYENGVTLNRSVTWQIPDPSTLLAGSHEVAGTVVETGESVHARIEVVPLDRWTGWDAGHEHWYDSGVMARSKEFYDPADGSWYYADTEGSIVRDADLWLDSDGGKWVHYDRDGRMVHGEWHDARGWYYFDASGKMAHGTTWISTGEGSGKWVYYDQVTGIMAHGERYLSYDKEHTGWYHFDEVTGEMAHGVKWIPANEGGGSGKWVYYDAVTGIMAHGERYLSYDREHTGWYHFDSVTGEMSHGDVWLSKGHKWVRYDRVTGQMVHGLQRQDDAWFYFDPVSGAMAHGRAWVPEWRGWHMFDSVTGRG